MGTVAAGPTGPASDHPAMAQNAGMMDCGQATDSGCHGVCALTCLGNASFVLPADPAVVLPPVPSIVPVTASASPVPPYPQDLIRPPRPRSV